MMGMVKLAPPPPPSLSSPSSSSSPSRRRERLEYPSSAARPPARGSELGVLCAEGGEIGIGREGVAGGALQTAEAGEGEGEEALRGERREREEERRREGRAGGARKELVTRFVECEGEGGRAGEAEEEEEREKRRCMLRGRRASGRRVAWPVLRGRQMAQRLLVDAVATTRTVS